MALLSSPSESVTIPMLLIVASTAFVNTLILEHILILGRILHTIWLSGCSSFTTLLPSKQPEKQCATRAYTTWLIQTSPSRQYLNRVVTAVIEDFKSVGVLGKRVDINVSD